MIKKISGSFMFLYIPSIIVFLVYAFNFSCLGENIIAFFARNYKIILLWILGINVVLLILTAIVMSDEPDEMKKYAVDFMLCTPLGFIFYYFIFIPLKFIILNYIKLKRYLDSKFTITLK